MDTDQLAAQLKAIEERLDFNAESMRTLNANLIKLLEAIAKKK